MAYRFARQFKRAAERGEENSKREHAGEQPALIDAKRRDHFAVLRCGAHQNPPPCAAQQEQDNNESQRSERNQQQIICRERLAEEIERSLQSRRPPPEQVAWPPDQHDQILDHERDAEGQEQLEQLVRPIDAAKQGHFNDGPDPSHDQRRKDDSRPETKIAGKMLGQRETDIGAEHIKRAMGKIDDAGYAENDRKTASGEKQR